MVARLEEPTSSPVAL
eukprot:Gb_16719 [translate_table: standard]